LRLTFREVKTFDKKIIWLAVAVVMIILIITNLFQYQQVNDLSLQVPRTINEIKESPEKYIGQKVAVEGYLVEVNNVYFLIHNPEFLSTNMPIPEEEYLIITSLDPKQAEEGLSSLVRIRGTVTEDDKEVNLNFDPSDGIYILGYEKYPILKYLNSLVGIAVIDLGRLFRYNPNYAVLISGGIRASNAYTRYWNDLKLVYSILINNYSYSPSRITVIYKNGVGEDSDMPVNYSATVANVTTALNDIAGNITNTQTLFIFTTNHGSGFWPTDPDNYYNYGGLQDTNGDEPETGYSEQAYGEDFNHDGDTQDTYPAQDEALNLYFNEKMRDDDFAALLDNISSNKTIVVMEQCFSGGFIHDLSGSNRIILTACNEIQPSWSADTEGSFDEFAFHFCAAINTGNTGADANSNGRVSMLEAFNFASQQDSRSEQCLYDDNGDGVGHQQTIPSGGDGTLGSNTYLGP
jgi:hypothetical protein